MNRHHSYLRCFVDAGSTLVHRFTLFHFTAGRVRHAAINCYPRFPGRSGINYFVPWVFGAMLRRRCPCFLKAVKAAEVVTLCHARRMGPTSGHQTKSAQRASWHI